MSRALNIRLMIDNAPGKQAVKEVISLAKELEKSLEKAAGAMGKGARGGGMAASVKSQSQAVQAELAKQTRAVEREAARQADAEERARYKAYWAGVKRRQKEEAELQRQLAREEAARERSAQRTARIEEQYFLSQARKRRAEQRREMAESGGLASSWAGSLTKVAAGYFTLATASSVLSGIGQATREAYDRQRQLTEEFARYVDLNRELATMQGKPATTATALGEAVFQQATGLNAMQADEFNKALLGRGAQYQGRFAGGQYDQFRRNVGSLTSISGISPEVMGDFAGVVMGARDWGRYGDNAATTATAEFNAAQQILMRGAGGNATLAGQQAKAAARLLSEDEMMGVFQSMPELASTISVMAQAGDQEAETYVRASIRGLRDFENPLIKKAGITAKDSFRGSLAKLAPVVASEAKAKGVSLQDVLQASFEDERTVQGLATGLKEGVIGKAFDDRDAYGAQFLRPGMAETQIAQAAADPTSAQAMRLDQARLSAAEQAKGAKFSLYGRLYTQAKTAMTADGSLESPVWDSVVSKLSPAAWLYDIDPKEERIQTRMREMLYANAGKAGLKMEDFFSPAGGSNLAQQQSLQVMMDRMAERGFDPLTGERLGRNGAQSIAETNRLLREISGKLSGPNGNRPEPLPPPAKPVAASGQF